MKDVVGRAGVLPYLSWNVQLAKPLTGMLCQGCALRALKNPSASHRCTVGTQADEADRGGRKGEKHARRPLGKFWGHLGKLCSLYKRELRCCMMWWS